MEISKHYFGRVRGYGDLSYLLLNAQRLAVTEIGFVAFRKAALECAPIQILVQSPISMGSHSPFPHGHLSSVICTLRWYSVKS